MVIRNRRMKKKKKKEFYLNIIIECIIVHFKDKDAKEHRQYLHLYL